MEKNIINLDLFQFKSSKSTVFTGRPQGEAARRTLDIDKIDNDDSIIFFNLPKETTTITPSFFLGLLYESIKKLKFENYKKKYFFVFKTTDEEIKKILEADIEECERNAINTIKGERGVGRFL